VPDKALAEVEVGLGEVPADGEQWLLRELGGGVGQAVAEVEPGGVATATEA
jgi:hypothetical protein